MFTTIPIRQVDDYIDSGLDMLLIDLRNKTSYDRCHIKGAVNIPFGELEGRIRELPRDRPLFFYCARGGQSMMACRYLEQRGYQVVDIMNGIDYYQGKYLVRE